jgi:PIN domain nuclease of toxin-antitoxin system
VIYVLDASAMIAYLRDEPGADVVEAALLDANNQCSAHAFNLCEVFYDFYRSGGAGDAAQAIADLEAMGVAERNDLDRAFWQEVGRLKAVHARVSLADCCGIALTNRTGGEFLTADHHELDPLAALKVCPIKFIR